MYSVLIVFNPESGDNSAGKYGNKLRDIFEKQGSQTLLYDISEKKDLSDIQPLIENHLIDTIAILGGDGTISSLVNEIAEIEDRPEVLLLPLGTTNNLARALGIELDLERLLEKVDDKIFSRKQIDIGKINDQYFVSTLSAGALPQIAWEAEDELKEQFGSFAYIMAGIKKVISKDESFSIKIKTKEDVRVYEDIRLLVIGLTNSIFGIPIFFEEGKVDDGKLHLFALKSSDLLNETSAMARFVLWNEEVENSDLSDVFQFTQAQIESSTKMHLALDGEKGPQFPIELEVLHKHLTVIVPEKN